MIREFIAKNETKVIKMLISKFSNGNVNDQIASIEKEYTIVLPSQYRAFLCKYNGGYTPKTTFKVGKISSDIRGFYGLGDVELSLRTTELREWLNAKVLPIACDSFGNEIVIALSGDDNGKIYFCDHEKGNKPDHIAEDLKSFFSCCESEKISDVSIRSVEEREAALIAAGRGDIITDALRQMWQAEIDKYTNMVREEVIIDER